MKIHVKIFGEDGKRIKIPMAIYRMRDFHMQAVATLMQMYGISEISLNITTLNFMPCVSVGIKTYLDDKLPAILKNEQPEIVRSLKIMLERFGFNSVSIELSPEEITKITQYWTYVDTGAPTPENIPVKRTAAHHAGSYPHSSAAQGEGSAQPARRNGADHQGHQEGLGG